MEIEWLEEAWNDLIEYRQNSAIITDGKVEEYINDLVQYVDTLVTSPYLGKEYFYHRGTEIRQLLYEMHRILYSIEGDKICILGVVHTARDIDANIMKYLDRLFN